MLHLLIESDIRTLCRSQSMVDCDVSNAMLIQTLSILDTGDVNERIEFLICFELIICCNGFAFDLN